MSSFVPATVSTTRQKSFVNHQRASQSTYIYRAPQCMSPRWNWDSPTPLPASECALPPGPKGGGAHSPTAKGVGESQFQRLEKRLALCLLCGAHAQSTNFQFLCLQKISRSWKYLSHISLSVYSDWPGTLTWTAFSLKYSIIIKSDILSPLQNCC